MDITTATATAMAMESATIPRRHQGIFGSGFGDAAAVEHTQECLLLSKIVLDVHTLAALPVRWKALKLDLTAAEGDLGDLGCQQRLTPSTKKLLIRISYHHVRGFSKLVSPL
jgi:hypothetical protein